MGNPMPFPESTVTGEFGDTGGGRLNPHRGRDFAPGGPPAPSVVTGTVVRSERQTGLGNVVCIRSDADGIYVGYAHLAERYVGVGARVSIGTNIGVVGNTGTLTTGRHLHFTTSHSSNDPASGEVFDPRKWFGGSSSTASSGAASLNGLSADTQKKYQQYLTNVHLYDGLIDGAFGQKSWAAVQQMLTNYKVYSGPIDGDPGLNTVKGMQQIAAGAGYGGPIDGEWGPNSDAGLNKWLTQNIASTVPSAPASGGGGGGGEYGDAIPASVQKKFQQLLTNKGLYSGLVDGAWGPLSWTAIQTYMTQQGVYDGPADGDPGTFSYQGLQKLAAKGGYTGPADGVLGPKSLEGLDTFLSAELAGGGVVTPPPVVVIPPTGAAIPTLPNGYIFGIDIASSQKGINLSEFKQKGGSFAIIKQGGGNASDSPYIAPQYVTQLAAARAAGLPVGHYWFNGAKNGLTPTTSARFFANHISLQEGDLVALDIESETDTGTAAYTPAEAMEFVTEFQKVFPEVKILLYMSVSVVRANASGWSAAVAKGLPLWLAMYNQNDGNIGSLPTNFSPWPEFAIWQYSSVVKVPGGVGSTDANIAKADLLTKYGYKKAPVVVIPDPPVVIPDPPVIVIPDPPAGDPYKDKFNSLLNDVKNIVTKYV